MKFKLISSSFQSNLARVFVPVSYPKASLHTHYLLCRRPTYFRVEIVNIKKEKVGQNVSERYHRNLAKFHSLQARFSQTFTLNLTALKSPDRIDNRIPRKRWSFSDSLSTIEEMTRSKIKGLAEKNTLTEFAMSGIPTKAGNDQENVLTLSESI